MSENARKTRDEFDLEVEYAEGHTPDLEQADPTMSRAHAEIAEIGAWWTAHAPPLRAPARAGASRWWLAAVPLALAAAALFVVVPRGDDSGSVDHRARGAPEVVIAALRQGAVLPAGEPLRGGDAIAVHYVPDRPVFVSVATLQEDGEISSLVVSAPASATEAFDLPGNVLLDDYTGREWLVVLSHPRPARPGRVRDEVLSLLPDPNSAAGDRAATFVREITRGNTRP